MRALALALALALTLAGCLSPMTPVVEYPDGQSLRAQFGQGDLWRRYQRALRLDGELEGAFVERVVIYDRRSLDGSEAGELPETIRPGQTWGGACRVDSRGAATLWFSSWPVALRLMRHELHHARLWRVRGLAGALRNRRHGDPSWEGMAGR